MLLCMIYDAIQNVTFQFTCYKMFSDFHFTCILGIAVDQRPTGKTVTINRITTWFCVYWSSI